MRVVDCWLFLTIAHTRKGFQQKAALRRPVLQLDNPAPDTNAAMADRQFLQITTLCNGRMQSLARLVLQSRAASPYIHICRAMPRANRE
jgi:hypothetical protein